MRSFVDTNVWVYAYESVDVARRDRARQVLAADPNDLWTSAQVMGELYVTLRRKMPDRLSVTDVRAIVDGLSRLRVVPLEADQVHDAIEIADRYRISYWDGLIVAAARTGGCGRLLTEDLADGSVIAGVRIENPFREAGHRLAEAQAPYPSLTSWDDAALREALTGYEAACRDAGMRPNAVHSYWDYARRFLDWREGLYPRHAAARPVPARAVGVADLLRDASDYEAALVAAGLRPSAIETYTRHARLFPRWLAGDFSPGARLARSRGARDEAAPVRAINLMDNPERLGPRTWTRDEIYRRAPIARLDAVVGLEPE